MENNEIEKIIAQAIGEGSMCWSKTPKRIFDSVKAKGIVEETTKKIKEIKKENKFSEARKLMNETLLKDKGLYISYQANIAMLLNDEQERNKSCPIDYRNPTNRNEIAKKIINLIFS